MESVHRVKIGDSRDIGFIGDRSVDMVVTSPPYPMIGMWDEVFGAQSEEFKEGIMEGNGEKAFEAAHEELDKVWRECWRVLKEGAFMCINIGDATRSIGGRFKLYDNHSRIVRGCIDIGFEELPGIIWRKQSNAPNKFMGSGMLPGGAYVTLEHEYILIFRKGGKRVWGEKKDKERRKESGYFWEERNKWFSDVWEVKGVRQSMDGGGRERSAAYPFEIPYRLINMYSQYGDVILDPFCGIGTTMIAGMVLGRDSIGVDIDGSMVGFIGKRIEDMGVEGMNQVIEDRVRCHKDFEKQRGEMKYWNEGLGSGVMTKQEEGIRMHKVKEIRDGGDECWNWGRNVEYI